MTTRDFLTDEDTGIYLVSTFSASSYLLDLNARTVRRKLGDVFHAGHAMRRDGEEVELLEVQRCALGSPMVLRLNLVIPNVFVTVRVTSTVLMIEQRSEDFARW